MVSTLDFESSDPSSNLGGTFILNFAFHLFLICPLILQNNFPMCRWFLSKLNCTHFVYTSIHKSSYYCAFVIFVAGTFVSLLFLLFSSYLAASWKLSIQLTSLHAPLSMLQWTSMKILVTHQSASYVHYQTMLKYL